MKVRFIFFALFVAQCWFIQPLVAKGNDLELGIRYLKLGNSYREIGFYNEAKDFLLKGKRIVTSHKNIYWQAVTEEYFGLLESDQGDEIAAEDHFIEAVKLYDKILPPSNSSLESTMHLLNPSQKFVSSQKKKQQKNYSKKQIEQYVPEMDMESPIEEYYETPIPLEEEEFNDLRSAPRPSKPTLPLLKGNQNPSMFKDKTPSEKESIGIEEDEFDKMVDEVLSGKPNSLKKIEKQVPQNSPLENQFKSLERENIELKQQIELLRNELELLLNKKEPDPKKATKSKSARSA